MRAKPRVLFLAQLLPWPLDGGGKLKSYHILRLLAQDYAITLLAYRRPSDSDETLTALAPLCDGGIKTMPLERSKAVDLSAAAAAVLTGQSFLVRRDIRPAMRAAVTRELAMGDYAALHVDHLQMMALVPAQTGRTKVILDEHNVEYRIPQRMAETAGGLMRLYGSGEWRRLRAFEQQALRRADLTLAVSDEDRCELQDLHGSPLGRIETVPIGVDTEYFSRVPRQPGATNLLSIGTMFWPPNVDSMRYFCAEIFPIIRQRNPAVTLTIVGAKPTAEILALGSDPAITVTGSVPDVRPWAESCGVFIVPLRSGSGMRVKILTALAMGLPTVSTTVGAEGIHVTEGENILLADGPQAFADAVLRLLSDPVLAERLSAGGRQLMEQEYSWDAIGLRLRRLYAEALAA